jgi:hypothetical protein
MNSFQASAFLLLAFITIRASAQDNYEIQVYGSGTVDPGMTILELHSNFTADGSREGVNGMLPIEHALHETLEVTHGVLPWFEIGAYLFTSTSPGTGIHWVGDHIRPRVRAPENWGWPMGVSLSAEAGYQRREYSEDTWTLELRPIVDKQMGKLYVSLNPTLEKALKGGNVGEGFEFSPNLKVSVDLNPVVTLGVEYYGSLGALRGFAPAAEQQHQIFPSVDLNVSPDWELNCGVGIGITRSTDHLIVKAIMGRRLQF